MRTFASLIVGFLLASLSSAFVPTSRRALVRPATTNANLFGNLFKDAEAGPKTVLEVPASDVKIGALRFLLQIYLVGEQNKPEEGSWFTKQGDDGDLQVYYKDGTGMVSLDLQEYSIQVTRYGEKPSLQYQLQESLLLHGVLDELTTVALGVEEIDAEKRLLKLKDDSAIEQARKKLPARQE